MSKQLYIRHNADGTLEAGEWYPLIRNVDGSVGKPAGILYFKSGPGFVHSIGLGRVEIRNTERAGLHAVRLSMKGNFKYHVCLKRQGTYALGSENGYRLEDLKDCDAEWHPWETERDYLAKIREKK